MAKTLRVHNLAKELGVPSKVIVEKCTAEGVPDITNHMSTVKIGLAVTVRQWFSDAAASDDAGDAGAVATAVETAQKVDVKKAKAKAKPARKKAVKAAEEVDAVKATPKATSKATAVNTVEAVAPALSKASSAPPAPVAPEANEPVTAAVVEAPAAKSSPTQNEQTPAAPAQAEAPADAAEPADKESKQGGPAGTVNVPTRPDIVKPAGQQMAEPKKVSLRGPKVIRVEKPEPVQAPRPRRSGGPGGGNGGGGMAPGQVEGITRSRGPARGRGAGGGAPDIDPGDGRGGRGGGGGGGRGGPGRGGPRGGGNVGGAGGRSRSTRRSGRDQLISGPTKLSGADIADMENRLKGAAGFVRQRRRSMNRASGGQQVALTPAQTGGEVEIEEPITIKSLSAVTGIKSAEVIKYLFQQGTMATVNSPISTELAQEVCIEYEIELIVKQQESALQILEKAFEGREMVDVQSRPAIVTVLGHVDHGKTSLLDRVRKADVAAHEDGGITQHIGAYRVSVDGTDGKEKTVVFVDTPGHEAFTAMRGRGARMTDLVVLVIAADDGVMPTTIEAINHAKAAGVPIVVALNKIDLPGVDTEDNLQRIYGQLAEHGLTAQAWGGEVELIKTSAETGDGVTELLEYLDLQAEVLELTADFGGPGRGTVIEAEMQTGRGSVARVMVQDGLMDVGSFFVAGRSYGRVRDMTDDRGKKIKHAGPATPLELSGIDGLPDAGDKFYICETLQKAEKIAKDFREYEREQTLATQKVTLQNFSATIKAGQAQTLNVVLKADVQGSVETLKPNLEAIGNDEVNVRVLHAAVGAVTESDVELAAASDGVIIGFHVTATTAVREIAEQRGVELRMYRVIYEITDDIKNALEGMLAPEEKETIVGQAKVQEVFRIGKLGSVAGCLVLEGSIKKTSDTRCRLERDGVIVTSGRELESLRRVKDDVKEVQSGTECGIRMAGFEDIKPDDLITCYTVEEVKRTLD